MKKLKINKAYAEIYNIRREKEELQKLKDKYGEGVSVSVQDESSSSESEDSDAEALTAEVERDWLCTLAAIKSRDPKIYDPKVTFYHQNDADKSENESHDRKIDSKKKKKKEASQAPMFLKDYERKVITERGGRYDDDDEERGKDDKLLFGDEEESDVENEEAGDSDVDDDDDTPKPAGYYAEQESAKASLHAAINEDDSEEEEEDLLTVRKASKEDKEREEEEYVEWLKGKKQELTSTDKQIGMELVPLKKYWNDPNLGDDEKFLRDFILNKDYLDDGDDEDRLPTYEEILKEEEELAADAEQLEKEERFETKFNFRFEEPDAELIKSYPRTISSSMRNKDNRRVENRKLAKERKQKKMEQKREELKRLKNLKKKEILDRIEKLKEITGNRSVGFVEEDLQADLEKDFDPSQHDKLMKKVLGSDYYDQDNDDTKPVFDDEEGEFDYGYEDWDNWEGPGGEDYQEGEGDQLNCEHPDFNMDADYTPSARKKGKKSKFAEAVEQKKPLFDPAEKSFEDYFNEYYNLEYEDFIEDMPVRFKYRQVTPNDFGLSADEILRAKDTELNSWVSLKKMSQYRTKEEEMVDVRIFKKKANNKYRVLTSLVTPEEPEAEDKQKKKKKKKKKSSACPAALGVAITEPDNESVLSNICVTEKQDQPEREKPEKQDQPEREKPEKKSKKNNKRQTSLTMSDERLKSYGINPKKFKYVHLKKLK